MQETGSRLPLGAAAFRVPDHHLDLLEKARLGIPPWRLGRDPVDRGSVCMVASFFAMVTILPDKNNTKEEIFILANGSRDFGSRLAGSIAPSGAVKAGQETGNWRVFILPRILVKGSPGRVENRRESADLHPFL